MSNHYHRQSLSLYAEFVLDIILVVQGVKYLPTNARDTRDTSLIPGLGRPPVGGGGMATHTSIIAWKIPWTEEPGGPKTTGLQRVKHV